jgi:DNA-binding CsgD family transcriptional regulator
MSDATAGEVFITLCDWHGRCVWTNAPHGEWKTGEAMWQHLAGESQERAKLLLARVVALRENQQLEVAGAGGGRFRIWLWPLNSPEVAVCGLVARVPTELALLTGREWECLELLAQGTDTRSIARRLGVSVSTIHTHMKRVREKLRLATAEALVSFAARFCYPAGRALASQSAAPNNGIRGRRG